MRALRTFGGAGWLAGEDVITRLDVAGDVGDDLARWHRHIDDDGAFVAARFFQRFELAFKQGGRHEMAAPGGEARGDRCFVAAKIDQTHIASIADQNVAIGSLQR